MSPVGLELRNAFPMRSRKKAQSKRAKSRGARQIPSPITACLAIDRVFRLILENVEAFVLTCARLCVRKFDTSRHFGETSESDDEKILMYA